MIRKEEFVVMIGLLAFLLVVILKIALFPSLAYASDDIPPLPPMNDEVCVPNEYGGGCTLVTVQYWSPEYGAYITTYEWDCPSSTMQPRSFQGYNYGYNYGYDSSGSYHSYYY